MFKLNFWPKPDKHTKILIALGNPEGKYKNTYHNVGFLYADYLANTNKIDFKKYKNDFIYAKSENFVIIKLLSFMNNSGVPTLKALKYFNVKPEDLVLIHDDSDLELGQYKTSSNRGSAGHKGVESVIHHLKTKNFNRIRIGIRKKSGKAGQFVLKEITKEDLVILDNLFSRINFQNF
ncbi:MAG: aminoacyl-tRNA hydrolase [Candidatus Colwellbacteria bacterium CG10_big_fil_rev_8_21_14_0_10_42_22]|uniref:Aminoacyl-tRNA hydrolase n=1 Tax=Candidatus Colwellbacteria bacterium CG10_big_fil_rev_8_21_14_0_10_42_22 TaxID=1974540 RepID=A0A2H0VGG0_9BACT|nr:MAG: aminoacyl-tRNA hydrolase [Candidatus Colwellbacteria bacterium CG10_big_fil_rev_8_21_14_0_10_42_22]